MNFDDFWKAYPRKVGKPYCRKIWDKIKPSQDQIHRMLKALEWQKDSDQWKRDNGQYIPHPSTWLNQGRWDDQPCDVGRATPTRKCKYCGDVAVGRYCSTDYCMNPECRARANGTYDYLKQKGML